MLIKLASDIILNLIILEVFKMILKNKLTKKLIQISYIQFQNQFVKEIQVVLENYVKTQNNKKDISKKL